MKYYEVKAFKEGRRRFENLDSIDELNEFVNKFSALGFNKFIVKSFDSEGFSRKRFFRWDKDNGAIFLN